MKFIRCLIAILTCSLCIPAVGSTKELPAVTVLADSSLMEPLAIIGRQYTRAKRAVVSTSFASGTKQVQEIEAGMEANVFISPRNEQIEALKQRGLIDVYSQTSIARNRLALASDAKAPITLTSTQFAEAMEELQRTQPFFLLAIGDPNYLSYGSFAQQVLKASHMEEQMEPQLAFPNTAEGIYRLLALSPSVALTYASETKNNARLKPLLTIEESLHRPIIYQAVVVAGSQPDAARDFIQYLLSDKAQAVFKAHGFEGI